MLQVSPPEYKPEPLKKIPKKNKTPWLFAIWRAAGQIEREAI